jgi:hypothetical protein
LLLILIGYGDIGIHQTQPAAVHLAAHHGTAGNGIADFNYTQESSSWET